MLVRWAARPTQAANSWREINRVLDQTFGLANDGWFDQSWTPAVDVSEAEKSFVIALEIPGVKADEVKVSLDGNRLVIAGEKKQETGEQSDRTHRFGRRFGSFSRTFTLPETVHAEGITAKAQDGVLTVTVPKAEKVQPRAIPVAS